MLDIIYQNTALILKLQSVKSLVSLTNYKSLGIYSTRGRKNFNALSSFILFFILFYFFVRTPSSDLFTVLFHVNFRLVFHRPVYTFSTIYWFLSIRAISSKEASLSRTRLCHSADISFTVWRFFTHEEPIKKNEAKKNHISIENNMLTPKKVEFFKSNLNLQCNCTPLSSPQFPGWRNV